jgi:hypothetical protein
MNVIVSVTSLKPFFAAQAAGAKPSSWRAELKGELQDIEYLSKELGGAPLPATTDPASLRLTIGCSRLDGVSDLPTVVDEIDRLVAVLNGLLKLLRLSKTPLDLCSTMGIDAAGQFCGNIVMIPGEVQVVLDDGETITLPN